jgi:hypothetical protein
MRAYLLILLTSLLSVALGGRSSAARAAAAAFRAAVPRRSVTVPPVRADAGSALGSIYAVTSNGTTNQLNFISVNLDTWQITVGPALPPTLETFGQASLYSNASGTPLLWSFIMSERDNHIAGFDVRSGTLARMINCSTWPGGGPFFVEAIFAHGDDADDALLVIGSFGSADPTVQSLYVVSGASGPAPTTALLGNISCNGLGGYCADATVDVAGGRLFQISGEDDTGDSGALVVTDLATLAQLNSYALENNFGFAQYDAATETLLGLTLFDAAGGSYARNVTVLANPGGAVYNATSHGAIGEGFYVDLSDGPKAFDPATRRIFLMLAGGPFAEFDVVTVDADSVPPRIEEAPGLCGFIGYCPQAFAFGPAAG